MTFRTQIAFALADPVPLAFHVSNAGNRAPEDLRIFAPGVISGPANDDANRSGAYQSVRPLPFSTGQWGDSDPAIAPDPSLIVFSSNRPLSW